DEREERNFAWFEFGCLGKGHAPLVVEIVTGRLDILQRSVLLPDLPCSLTTASIKLDVLFRNRYAKSIDVSHLYSLVAINHPRNAEAIDADAKALCPESLLIRHGRCAACGKCVEDAFCFRGVVKSDRNR